MADDARTPDEEVQGENAIVAMGCIVTADRL